MRPLLAAAFFLLVQPALAQDLTIGPNDSLQSVLAAQKGKRVTVRVGGQEMTGTVREATARLVVLAGLTGREFFDAAVPLDRIEAVIVRTKQ